MEQRSGQLGLESELQSHFCLETPIWQLSVLRNHNSDERGLPKYMSPGRLNHFSFREAHPQRITHTEDTTADFPGALTERQLAGLVRLKKQLGKDTLANVLK